MTRREKIKYIYPLVQKEFNKVSNLPLLPLQGSLFDLEKSYNRYACTFNAINSSDKGFRVKRESVSPSLWIAILIVHDLGDVLSANDFRKVLNNIILSNPKKYYIK